MDFTLQQQKIESFVQEFIKETPEVFLVEVSVRAGNNISVYVDADKGLTIDTCTRINRALYNYLEEEAMFPDNDFSLEVSSPGVEEPLKLLRQYEKNIGRKVEIEMQDGSKKEGKLLSAGKVEITIEEAEGKGKKAIIKTTTILFDQIRHTKVLITF